MLTLDQTANVVCPTASDDIRDTSSSDAEPAEDDADPTEDDDDDLQGGNYFPLPYNDSNYGSIRG